MRTTNDKKDHVIRVRLNDDMFNYLCKASTINNISISQHIRNIIEKEIHTQQEIQQAN